MNALLALAIALSPVNLPSIDTMPVCAYEDGSDAATLPCVWTDPDTGDAYITYADHSDLVVVAHGVAAPDGAVPGPVA